MSANKPLNEQTEQEIVSDWLDKVKATDKDLVDSHAEGIGVALTSLALESRLREELA